MDGARKQTSEVLEFWFVQSRPRQWFAKQPAVDALLRERFLDLTRQALRGVLDVWGTEAGSGRALVLLLDQFPRQIWRDTTMAFVGDKQALALSLKAVERGWLETWLCRRRPCRCSSGSATPAPPTSPAATRM